MNLRAEWWNAQHHPAHAGCRRWFVLMIVGASVCALVTAAWSLGLR